VVGMAANPFGAHQVGTHIADHMAYRYATGHDVVGRAGRRSDQVISRAGTPLGANSLCNGTENRFHGTGNFGVGTGNFIGRN
jgi:hypothetical protein